MDFRNQPDQKKTARQGPSKRLEAHARFWVPVQNQGAFVGCSTHEVDWAVPPLWKVSNHKIVLEPHSHYHLLFLDTFRKETGTIAVVQLNCPKDLKIEG